MADDRESYLTWRETAQPEQPQQPSVAAPEAYTNWRDEQGALASERAALLIENAIPAGDAVAADARAAEARGQGMELAPDLLADAQSELSRRIEAQTRRAQLMTSSRLSGWVSQDPMNAALAQMELQNLSTTASLFNSLGRGFDRTATGWWNRRRVRGAEDDLTDLQNVIVDRDRSFGSIVDDIRDGLTLEDFDINPGVTVTRTYATALSRFISSRLTFVGDETLERHEGILVEELDRALQLQASNTSRIEQSYGVSTNVARMNTALHDIGQLEGVGEQMSALGSLMVDEPGAFSEWLANVVVESAPGLTAGAATTYATRQPAAGAAVMGATSYVTGEAMTFDQFVREAGYDLNDPEQRAALVNDPEMRQLLRDRAFAYGAVVGMFDAASGGVASRTFVNNPAGELMLQSMAQSLMGGGGEAFAQLASGQDLNMVEIMVEGLAEFATAPVEAAGVGGRYLQERRTVIQDREFFDALAQSAGESEMRTQAPARYRNAIEALTADGPVENLYVAARALDELFQSDPNGVTAEQFLNAVPGVDAEAYRQALETGGTVEIPTASYASDIVGTRFDELVREHLRTQPENMSAAELRAYKSQLDDLSAQAQTIADRAESGQTELERVAEDARVELVSALRRAGRTADVAENEALQAVAFARTTAERTGIELGTFLQRYPLADVQSALDSDPSVRTPVVTMEVLERVRQEPSKDDEAERELMAAMREAAEVADLDLANADPVDLERAILEAYGPDESTAILNQLSEELDLEELIAFADTQIEQATPEDLGTLETYPVALPPEYEFSNYEEIGGKIVEMSPDKFLRLSSELVVDEDVLDNARDLAQMMLDGREIDPPRLTITDNGTVDSHDGRHRAIAAKMLGIDSVPVLLMGEQGGAFPQDVAQLRPQAGATGTEPELFQSAPPTESEAFRTWAGTGDVIDADDINDTNFAGEGPWIMRAFHGTTHSFEEFDASVKGTKEGQFGAVNYFTSSYDDADGNYGDSGPDLTSRIENAQERATNELESALEGLTDEDQIVKAAEDWVVENYPDFDAGSLDTPPSDAIAEAEEGNVLLVADYYARQVSSTLQGGEAQVLEVFIRTEKPFVVGADSPFMEFTDFEALDALAVARVAEDRGVEVSDVEADRDTYEDAIDEARWEIESEEPNPLYEAVQTVADRYDADASTIFADIDEFAREGGRQADLEKALRASEGIAYAEDPETGDIVGYHMLAEIIQKLGFDSIVLKDANERFSGMDMSYGTAHIHVFDENNTNIKSVDNQGTFDPEDPRILYQKKGDKRGSILLPSEPDRAPLVTLFPKADLSTFLHESGHYYLHVLQDIAARGEQSTSMSEDWQTINDWWRSNIDGVAKDGGVTQEQVQAYLDNGTTGDKDVDRKVNVGLQEQWARAYESYLMAGKAPSNALRSAFEAFSAWLLSVYRRAKGLNVEVGDDLRGVFDRLLATDEEIAAATADNGFDTLVAQSAEQLGVDETEYQKLVKLSVEAQDEAKQKLLLEVMAPVRRAQTEAYRAERKGVEAEITEKVNAKPANRVREWLGNQRWLDGDAPSELADDLRLDRQLLIDEHGEGILTTLPRGRRALYAKDTGLSADDVAGWFGYKSGSEMLQDISTAPKAKDEIKARTEAEMRKRHGDPLGDGSIEAQAVEALHGEKRGQLLAAELKAISKAARKDKVTTRSQAAEIARRTIRQMPIRKAVRSGQYLAAERRAGERASLAVARGDMDAAFTAKHEQLLNHQLYVESRKADTILSRVESRVTKLKSKGTRKNLAGEYLDAIDDILTSYDFRKSVTQRAAKRRAGLQQYVEMMKAAGRENELAIPVHVLDEAKRRPYKTLPVNELEGVLDSLRNIEHTARMKQKLRDAQRERDLTEVVGSITAEMEANLKDNAPNRVATPGERAAGGFREFANLLLNADTLLRKIGGFDRGDAYDAIKAPIDDAADWASVERERAATTFEELYSVYDKKEQRQMAVRRHYGELGGAFTKWDLISAALNMGNSDNLARLMDKDSGGGFNAAQVEFIKQQLDKRDWDFVQSAWEVVNSYWPQIEARERRLTGVAPKKVQAAEVETPYGTYQGGYYPIRYRSDISGMVASEELAEVQQRMMAGRFGKAQTRNGHLEERARGSGGRVLQLGMEVMHQHIGQVVHDLAFSEAVANSWRVLQDPRVRGAFEQKGLLKDHQALEMWLQDTATGQLSAGGVFGRLALRAKNGFTLSKLAFNMSTVAIQLTGITQSVAVLGSKNMAHGYSTYLSNPKRTSQEVVEMSPFMRERETTFNRDINDILGDVMVGPAASRARRFQQGLARVGFWLMQKVQFYGVDVPTWYAGYRQGVEKFGNDEAKARSHADRMVARAQASGVFSDRSAFERGTLSTDTRQNGFVRLFTALGSYMFAKGNVAYEVYGRTARDVDGMNLKSLQAAVKGAVDMALLFTVEAIAYNLIKGTLPGMGDDDDDDSWSKFLARETALSMMSTIPGVRDLGSSLAGFEAGAYGSVIETFTRPMIQAAQGEADMALFKALSNAAGVATGLPSGQLNRTADAWYRLEEGDDVAPIEFIMGRR